ncbi:molybdenum ABC transporter, periplasmic molybdate-binding protein [Stanieria cyanosphaera PCC 7437]|uniref:Molybdenum ABC transporter, periplasmic molybdate-binding protein n=1 Tax=Stanieria cyanosphaera (strain ATCC 29371 / PCC 7437) TaxID=111780 RepID=K9XX29_STAC7|nr:molybdate ABC transporter substrate-binding protein [Stanieria cyanosphaera]AFZ37160.1 molybdenum ABC transporter, periplasmic molybdate-binding protein [Stanieria cyanosphaera PCC 7437]
MKIKRQYFFLSGLVGLLVAFSGLFLNQSFSSSASQILLAQRPVTLTVSAAADLNYVFKEIGALWEKETGNKVTFNFGSTGQLAQQIERGAPVDLFAAANKSYIEDLDKEGLIVSDTKAVYGRGRITVWTREDSKLNPKDIRELTKPEYKRVAIANPDHAPYGIAAREAFQTVGIWDAIKPKLVLGENIAQTQQYAETGNVDVGIVALSLSVNRPGKWELIPENLHQPIDQMLAVVKKSKYQTQAREFAQYINGPTGRPLMKKYGFVLPEEKAN